MKGRVVLRKVINRTVFSFLVFYFAFLILHAVVWGDKLINLKSLLGYFGVTSLIATILFVISISAIDKGVKGLRRLTTIILMILGNYYLFLLAMNLIYEFNENMLLVITLSGFSIFLFDVSYSLFVFNVKHLKSKGGWKKNKEATFKAAFMLIVSIISIVLFIVYVAQTLMSIPETIKAGVRVIDESKFFTSFLTLFPIGLTLLYLSHKVEKSEDGFKDLPWK